jgi:uncharacterized protein (TIGR02186 family)
VRFAALLAALLIFTVRAGADENLISGLSQDVVEITSNYTGTNLTVFGAIERPAEKDIGDIVVVVRGPDATITVRRKDRVAGLWINDARARLVVPSYYFIASTRPLGEIASADTLQLYDLGLGNISPEHVLSDGDPAPYELALVRAQMRTGLYRQDPTGVEMLSATLFRVKVPVPASVPRGAYNVQVYLFRDGSVVAAQSTPLYVDQTGIERRVYAFAHDAPLTYGLSTVFIAVMLGWASTFLFRRR